ncbi:NADP-dependent 3-hydroxy acid dehydrogenase YdfG [Loktanella fryxellensis]|uniref:NADP-dependent 3-hydroxy acid dehydrogenase YdfG n=1 Tax=Loktanella fryxellensis TaxID=245187 RepID=A0A1H7YVX5_9RHOB|nr:SDR family NAD(P)-dependent oxidoreductase [Loktanella fryxellensis]SEM50061.1 NADP-dependent 3-hydroxy acid dehydrogenase YdfG [Loktanella fryxellensis]
MTDQIALITGASRGLGAAIATALAGRYHIVAVARTIGALEELDDAIQARGGQATLAPMDITTDAAMQQLCRGIHDRWGHLDLWVHTAIHAAPLSPAAHIAPKDFASSLDVNVTAVQRLIGYVAPLLGSQGRAVFCDDTVAGTKFHGTYGATKAAQLALVRSWQAETAQTGPQVMLIDPAPMPTALRARFHPGEDRNRLAHPATEAARLLDAITG